MLESGGLQFHKASRESNTCRYWAEIPVATGPWPRYLHVFDFAAGFYGIAVHPIPTITSPFFVEGRGYFAYLRMRLESQAATEVRAVTGERFHDLIAKAIPSSS